MNDSLAGDDATQVPSSTPGPDQTATFSQSFIDQVKALEAVDVTPEEQEAIASLPSGSALLIVRRGPSQGARFLLDVDVTTGYGPEIFSMPAPPASLSMARPWRSDVVVSSISWITSDRVLASLSTAPVRG